MFAPSPRTNGWQQAQSPADSMRRLERRGGAKTVMFVGHPAKRAFPAMTNRTSIRQKLLFEIPARRSKSDAPHGVMSVSGVLRVSGFSSRKVGSLRQTNHAREVVLLPEPDELRGIKFYLAFISASIVFSVL
jgi:hypothetical protein